MVRNVLETLQTVQETLQTILKTLQTVQAVATALGCPREELGGKTLLLMIPNMLVTSHEEIKLVLTRKLLP